MKFAALVLRPLQGIAYEYPLPLEAATYRYDFVYFSGDIWCYLNSTDSPELSSTFKHQAEKIETKGGMWRVIDALTGEIVLSSGPSRQSVNSN